MQKMGEIILKFDSIEEADDARDALDGYKWKLAMWDLDQELRNKVKYDEALPADVAEAFELLRDEIRDILNDYNLKME
jgi:hypothetical protein